MGKYGYSIYMGGLSERIRTRDVEDFFRGYGKILDISLKAKFGKKIFFFWNDSFQMSERKGSNQGVQTRVVRVPIFKISRVPSGPGPRFSGVKIKLRVSISSPRTTLVQSSVRLCVA